MKVLKIISFLLLLTTLGKAQNNFTNIDAIANRLVNNLRQVGAEKILLETNKKIYASQETIWFKALEVDSITGRLKGTSKKLFADLVDDNDKVIHHLVLNIETAQQVGAFLPDSSLSGLYWIRAYTKNILNRNINNIAVKPVYILNINEKANNKFNKDNTNAATADNNSLLTFYPEGGYLISGAASLVAVKLTDQNGNGFSDSILIKDNRNDVIARFSTNTYGLGKFVFEPSSYRKYSAFILKNNHYDSVTNLPATNPFAAEIAVTEQAGQTIKTRVLLEDSIYKKEYRTYLIGLSKDSICIAAEGRGNYELNVPLTNFPAGVASLLLFNADGMLLSERNIYINKNNIIVTVQTEKNVYAAREKVNMNIAITDANGKPVLAALSIAVNDSRVSDSINFSSDLLANLSANDADLFMLTEQKQNAAYWQNMYTLQTANTTSENNDNLYINGMLLNKKKQPAPDKSIMLISTEQNGFVLQDTTNKAGKFTFQLANFTSGTPFSMQVNRDRNTQDDYYVVLDSVVYSNFKTPLILKTEFSAEQLLNLKKTKSFYMNSEAAGQNWLPEVKVTSNNNLKKTKVLPDATISRELLHSGRVNNVGDAILQFSKLRVIGGYLMAGGPNGFKPSPNDEPIIVIDGVRANTSGGSVLAFLKTISAEDVDHINVLTGTAASGYGLISGTGVIEIYTASNKTDRNGPGGLQTIFPKGFDTAPEFKMPDYNDKHLKTSKNDDARTSLYWDGNLTTDEKGVVNISFFTADIPATYLVTISGITAKGDRIYKTVLLGRK